MTRGVVEVERVDKKVRNLRRDSYHTIGVPWKTSRPLQQGSDLKVNEEGGKASKPVKEGGKWVARASNWIAKAYNWNARSEK